MQDLFSSSILLGLAITPHDLENSTPQGQTLPRMTPRIMALQNFHSSIRSEIRRLRRNTGSGELCSLVRPVNAELTAPMTCGGLLRSVCSKPMVPLSLLRLAAAVQHSPTAVTSRQFKSPALAAV